MKRDLRGIADPGKAAVLAGFFKTGKGEYGEGDIFLGVVVPEVRRIARRHRHLSLEDIEALLRDGIHECRLAALIILVERFEQAAVSGKARIAQFYLSHLKAINNWDLVDLSAPKILGGFLCDRDKSVLYELARSPLLWERRIAIMSTMAFITERKFDDALRIAELLLGDTHDLIHKAVGWMLREVGKRDLAAEESFLRRHHARMPRTMLRYAIERFKEKKRRYWLKR